MEFHDFVDIIKMTEIYTKSSLATVVRKAAPRKKWQLSDNQVKLLKTSAHIILAVAAVAGVVALATIAPNIFLIMGKSNRFKPAKNEERRKQVTKSFYYLKRKGYIEWDRAGQELILRLTSKGKEKLNALNFQTLRVEPSKKWDGKWWLVLADVPQESRTNEDYLRAKLKDMGFCSFQRSVWAYPHNPRTEVDIISKFYQIESFVTTMRIDKLEKPDEVMLKEFFRKKGII